jgi:hypothetical protein
VAGAAARRAENRDAEETERLNRLRLQQGALADAIALAEEFAALVRARVTPSGSTPGWPGRRTAR